MHCPECHSLNDDQAAACTSCGLLLINVAHESDVGLIEPAKRRAEDYAGQRRRAADKQSTHCGFCNGEIKPTAIRCQHCSEIVNEDYYRERSQRIRSRVNYASWIAYLFGLAALLVFRPVGLVSIAAGLLLSIAYYAIPVEPPTAHGKKKPGIGTMIRKQFKMERVAVPIPGMRNKKLIFIGTPLIAALVGYSANILLLQQPVNQIMKENGAFAGMKVSAHYQYYIVPGVVVYDLETLSVRQTPIDVHTAFLEFAKKMREKRYSRVELSWKGTTKFSIDGASFRKLGEEYAKRNFDYVLYQFPRQLTPSPGGSDDRDALLKFHKQWYGDDRLTKSVANGMM